MAKMEMLPFVYKTIMPHIELEDLTEKEETQVLKEFEKRLKMATRSMEQDPNVDPSFLEMNSLLLIEAYIARVEAGLSIETIEDEPWKDSYGGDDYEL
jgi:hypothetical protein